jgi:Holliday junction resolvasome RuvABC endonuclease subunit
MIIAGIDYSYTSPAICVYDTTKEFKFDNLKFYNVNGTKNRAGQYGNISIDLFPEYETTEQRFRNICIWASAVLSLNKVEEACIEGYALGSSSGLVFQIAENASLIKQFMDLNDIKFTTPTPSQVKKNFTGKGNAKKDVVVETFYKTMGIKVHEILGIKEMAKPIDDICDSLAVLRCHSYFNEVKE